MEQMPSGLSKQKSIIEIKDLPEEKEIDLKKVSGGADKAGIDLPEQLSRKIRSREVNVAGVRFTHNPLDMNILSPNERLDQKLGDLRNS